MLNNKILDKNFLNFFPLMVFQFFLNLELSISTIFLHDTSCKTSNGEFLKIVSDFTQATPSSSPNLDAITLLTLLESLNRFSQDNQDPIISSSIHKQFCWVKHWGVVFIPLGHLGFYHSVQPYQNGCCPVALKKCH